MARDWWQKGSAFDLWSIPHFLFGILMAFVPMLTDLSFSFALVLTLVLAVLWELFEMGVGIRETVLNSLLDVFLPIVAYIITSYFLLIRQYHRDELVVFAVAVLLLYLFTNISGWLAYRRRQRDFI
ncbi:MAG: hypothetical protein Q7R59_00040 [bacterium]|nr:hypothetical protein [bacterium]